VVGRDILSQGELDLSLILPALRSSEYKGKLELELFERDVKGRDPVALINLFSDEIRQIFRP